MKYLYIVFASLIFIVGCEKGSIDEPDETFWEFDINATSYSGYTWSSISHYYCSGHNEGNPQLLLDYQAPDNKIYRFVISPRE